MYITMMSLFGMRHSLFGLSSDQATISGITAMEASGPPYKRRRLVNEQSSPSSAPSPQNVRIKREESESPLPQRRVVTSGSKRYVMPNDCEKGQFNFKRNRQVWSQREADALRSRGFKPIRMFIRCVSTRLACYLV